MVPRCDRASFARVQDFIPDFRTLLFAPPIPIAENGGESVGGDFLSRALHGGVPSGGGGSVFVAHPAFSRNT